MNWIQIENSRFVFNLKITKNTRLRKVSGRWTAIIDKSFFIDNPDLEYDTDFLWHVKHNHVFIENKY